MEEANYLVPPEGAADLLSAMLSPARRVPLTGQRSTKYALQDPIEFTLLICWSRFCILLVLLVLLLVFIAYIWAAAVLLDVVRGGSLRRLCLCIVRTGRRLGFITRERERGGQACHDCE